MNKLFFITAFLLAVRVATCADGTLDRLDKVEKAEKGTTIYSPIGKRDPFKPPSLDALGRESAALNPLERFSIEQFQLRAILKGLGRSRAMLEDPEGRTYIIGDGDIVGRERATVSRILNTGVVLTERTFNYLGQESLYEKVLSLPSQREDGVIEDLTPPNRRGGRRNEPQGAVPFGGDGIMPQGFLGPGQANDRPPAGGAPNNPAPAPVNFAQPQGAGAPPQQPQGGAPNAAPAAGAPQQQPQGGAPNAAPAAAAPAANGNSVPTITNRGNNGGLTY